MLQKNLPPPSPRLQSIADALALLRIPGSPSVPPPKRCATSVERTVRVWLAQPLSHDERAWLHLGLAAAWATAGQIDEALAIEGAGDGAERDAVRAQALAAGANAATFTAAELFDCASEPNVSARIEGLCAPGRRLGWA